jgi:hypothetical protein
MFYSHLILTRKGPLGSVWIAATVGERSVSKRLAATAQIGKLCRSIQAPDAPFALRLSAHLMLGVTRIYARKSAFVLADMNALLHSLHRFSATHTINERKRKREGDASESTALLSQADVQDPFSLATANNFAKITLPVRKKRLLGQHANVAGLPNAGGNAVDGQAILSTISAQSAYADNLTMFALPWEASQIPLDIEAALAMAFPSVKMEPVEDANSLSTNRAQSRSTYRAREQDITMPMSEQRHYFGNAELLPSSIGRDEQRIGAGSESPQTLQLGDAATISGSASNLMSPPVTSYIEENANDELLNFGSKRAAATGHGDIAHAKRALSAMKQESNNQQRMVSPSHNSGSECASLKADHQLKRQPAENGGEPMHVDPPQNSSPPEDHQIEIQESTLDPGTEARAQNDTKSNIRAKRVGGPVLDIVTEFSESRFRGFFLDTSDILIGRHDRHPTKKTKNDKAPAINRSSVCFAMVGQVAPALQSLWENLIGPNLDAWSRPVQRRPQKMVPSTPLSSDDKLRENVQIFPAMREEECTSSGIQSHDKHMSDEGLQRQQSDSPGEFIETARHFDVQLAAENNTAFPEGMGSANLEPEQLRDGAQRSVSSETAQDQRALSFISCFTH